MHPTKAFCHAALHQRCPPGPVKAVGPTGVHLRILYPKLVLQIISALCRVFLLIASRGFESRIIHTRSYTGGRIIAQPGLNSAGGNELMKKPNRRHSVFAPVARWRECGWGETSGLPGLGLFVPMEISLCHPRQDQYMAWDNGGHGEGSPAFSSRLRKMRKNRSSQGQPVVRWQPGRLGSLLPLKGHGFLNLVVSLVLVRLAQLWAL